MKILMHFAHFPVSIPRYFLEAFRRNGHTVYTTGPAFENWIPWTAEGAKSEGMALPTKYILRPDVPLEIGHINTWGDILSQLPEPVDFVLNHATPPGAYTAAIVGRPKLPYAHLFTDPHVLEWHYKTVRWSADYCFNMQACYMPNSDHYIPYAYAPQHHYVNGIQVRDIDAACIGLQYPTRKAIMEELRADGYSVMSRVGDVFDEYRGIYNRAKIAFSWSSKNDTIARVFEAPRMGAALVCNKTPDLKKFFHDSEITVFTDSWEAVAASERLIEDESLRWQKADGGIIATEPHTYDHRAQMIAGVIENKIPASMHNAALDKWLDSQKESRASA